MPYQHVKSIARKTFDSLSTNDKFIYYGKEYTKVCKQHIITNNNTFYYNAVVIDMTSNGFHVNQVKDFSATELVDTKVFKTKLYKDLELFEVFSLGPIDTHNIFVKFPSYSIPLEWIHSDVVKTSDFYINDKVYILEKVEE